MNIYIIIIIYIYIDNYIWPLLGKHCYLLFCVVGSHGYLLVQLMSFHCTYIRTYILKLGLQHTPTYTPSQTHITHINN